MRWYLHKLLRVFDKFIPVDRSQGNILYMGPLENKEEPDLALIKDAVWRIKPSSAPGINGNTAGMLRKVWPALCMPITILFGKCISNGLFPDCWKTAKLILIPKSGTQDAAHIKSYRPISLLPVLGKALETLIINNIVAETNLNAYEEQYGFTTGRSTVSALEVVMKSVNSTKSRHVFGTFLDITGAFDNVKWSPLITQIIKLGASLNTVRMVRSYLDNRWACFDLENTEYSCRLQRGCPQGSQLGPTLWKVAISAIYQECTSTKNSKLITYADDILLIIGAARPITACGRIEKQLDKFKLWAIEFALKFSAGKSQLLSLKGGLKQGFTIGFGTAANAPRILSSATAKYLGVILDPRQSYWGHILAILGKSSDLYSRLRGLYSANWGMGLQLAPYIRGSFYQE